MPCTAVTKAHMHVWVRKSEITCILNWLGLWWLMSMILGTKSNMNALPLHCTVKANLSYLQSSTVAGSSNLSLAHLRFPKSCLESSSRSCFLDSPLDTESEAYSLDCIHYFLSLFMTSSCSWLLDGGWRDSAAKTWKLELVYFSFNNLHTIFYFIWGEN